jgi:hypothetical protein
VRPETRATCRSAGQTVRSNARFGTPSSDWRGVSTLRRVALPTSGARKRH